MKEKIEGLQELNENKKGVDKMKEEVKELINERGGDKMKELKELGKEIETKKLLLIETVHKWVQGLNPVQHLHIKVKGRYYPFIEKESSKLYVIDKLKGAKVPFNTLDQNMKYVIVSVLAERKEEIEKEVQEDKKKYLEKKLEEVNELLNKF